MRDKIKKYKGFNEARQYYENYFDKNGKCSVYKAFMFDCVVWDEYFIKNRSCGIQRSYFTLGGFFNLTTIKRNFNGISIEFF